MNNNKTALLKIFSAVLKDRAKSEPQYQFISPEMLKFFSRKELIEIITQNFEGEVPSEYKLVEMENNELLQLIGDDFNIISYMMSKWSKETARLPERRQWMDSKVHPVIETDNRKSLPEQYVQIPQEIPSELPASSVEDIEKNKNETKATIKKNEKPKNS